MVEHSQQEHNYDDDRRDSFSSRLSDDDAHHLDDDTMSLLSDRDNQTLLPTHHANASATSVFSFESIPMIPLTQTQTRAPELQKKVSFLNGLGLVIGSMIGSGLFSSPGAVMEAAGAPGTALLVWLVSGLLALMGALCYAELGTMLPMNGGESVYLNRAFGSLLSFCFEFATIVVQKPGSLAIIFTVFGEYVSRIAYHTYFFKMPHDSEEAAELADSVIPFFLPKLLAIVALIVVTLINAFSIRAGIRVQDALTLVKVLTALVISVVGIVMLAKGTIAGNSFQGDPFAGMSTLSFGQYSLALYSGLWAYDGWNNLNYVSGEMKQPHRDLPRVIIFGIPVVIVCYLLSNVAYLAVLRPEVVIHTNTVAMDFGKKLIGPAGGIVLAVFVALSCFGSANATAFTGARIIYVSAKQGHLPSFFGHLNASRQTPITALALQAVLTSIMIIIGSFRALVNFYSLSAWIFYFLAVLSLIVFRYKEPELKRPYKVWLPLPVLFCMIALFLCTMPFVEAPFESLAALGFVVLPIPIWLIQVKYREALGRLWTGLMSRIRGRPQGYQGMEMTEAEEL
ncbi:amino acid permease-domain-containing protein [Syncephalastrum racemosum]|uniref:Amino acid permease-domain-containing protein n=1 Tax=Syncephalastrum racemosum TaxID=13706 RepID=A0A1X2HK26_SYNRA|nr:amino acid permease-domain-containing protein [Syncephalastrum racemosum]